MNYSCRNCKSSMLKQLVSLKDMPLTDEFIPIKNPEVKEFLQDIEIHYCLECGLVQNPNNFNHEQYYKDYRYSSGYSEFAQEFMKIFSAVLIEKFINIHGKSPKSILEIGSGDGTQLKFFKKLENAHILGIEPSEFLANIAIRNNIPTHIGLFNTEFSKENTVKFDICFSSFTFDHVKNPVDYLKAAYDLTHENGIVAFEIHDLEKIVNRSEYCLFEHEHTIYLDRFMASRLVSENGFDVISINPIPSNKVRGNSLIVIASKRQYNIINNNLSKLVIDSKLFTLENRIKNIIDKLNNWIDNIGVDSDLIGFGAGGRGVMTLAALDKASRFNAIFDSNFKGGHYLTPKTRIHVVDPELLMEYSHAYCLVFSFGYFHEIKEQLLSIGFDENKIVSLAYFFLDSQPAS